jgi:hypothetical protein
MPTTYSFHRADDHSILDTANPVNLQHVAQNVASRLRPQGTVRLYVHNGKGVVAALLCRAGAAHDILRDDFMRCDDAARWTRDHYGLTNDPK